jgi:hypothetical protein
MFWERDGEAYHATVADAAGAVEFHLVVEVVPDGSWTWTIWRAGDPPRLTRYATSGTAEEAMGAAEQTAQ